MTKPTAKTAVKTAVKAATSPSPPNWGIMPATAIAQLKQREWDNSARLKARLKGEMAFPITLALKPPKTGNDLLQHPNHCQDFVQAWRHFAALHPHYPELVHWQRSGFRHFAEQNLPSKLVIANAQALAEILGAAAQQQLRRWQRKIGFIHSHLCDAMTGVDESNSNSNRRQNSSVFATDWKTGLFNALIDKLATLDGLDDDELDLVVKVIPQLHYGMGQGLYLRALPVRYVDTKFIETYDSLLSALLAAFYPQQINNLGLSQWLGCLQKPSGWLMVRPLCAQAQANMGGLSLLRLATEVLQNQPLPAKRILVVENEQSCLALPYAGTMADTTADTIAVAGGGKNINWMSADWLQLKTVGYWGDIDSEGLSILSQARACCPNLSALMMDAQTLTQFKKRMVGEPDSKGLVPSHLSSAEWALFNDLRQAEPRQRRLEQERLPNEYIEQALQQWRMASDKSPNSPNSHK